MTTKLVYNFKTIRMEKQEYDSTKSKDKVKHLVKGEVLKQFEQFAIEDGLDISTPRKRGQVINAYVHAAVEMFIAAREAAKREAVDIEGASDVQANAHKAEKSRAR